MKWCCIFFTSLALLGHCRALNNGLALTPPMGWLVWERFACNTNCDADPDNCISEQLFMQMADHLAADGFKDLGYSFINIDDCWMARERDSSGRLQPDPERFPHGIKYLADYIHSKGLKLGIYADLGTTTCAGYPGTLGHIQVDAQTFADWGVDMLKLDGCRATQADYETGYPNMSRALNSTGRPIVFSCSWPAYISNPNYTEIAEFCNLWRNYNDIRDSWQSVLDIILHYAQIQDKIQPFAGPGHWNDPDMLVIGDFGLSVDEQRAQMALWAIFAAPLLMSNDLRKLPAEAKAILQNKEVIAVNQDKLGIQGRRISTSLYRNPGLGEAEASQNMVFARPLSNQAVAVALLNTGSFAGPHNITVKFADAGLKTKMAHVRDLFEQKDLGTFEETFTATVNPSGVRLVTLTPVSGDHYVYL